MDVLRIEDVVPLTLLVFLTWFIGVTVSVITPPVRRWAGGCSYLCLLVYAACVIAERGPNTVWGFVEIAVLSAYVLALTYNLGLIAFPLLYYLYAKMAADRQARAQQRAQEEAQQRNAEQRREWEARAKAEEEQRLQKEAQERMEAEQRREQVARAEAEAAERERIAALSQPPPPTPAERVAAAKATYEERLRFLAAAGLDAIELKAAQDQAKQQYLKILNDIMR